MTRGQKKWFYGLASGFLGGMWTSIDSGLIVMIAAPNEFNFGEGTLKTLGVMTIIGILAGAKVAVAYMKQSPLPPMEGDTQIISKQPTNGSTMKVIIGITAVLFCIYAKTHAAGSYLDNISVSPYATIVHDGVDEGESYGAGLTLGLGINKFVSIDLSATTYSDNDWRDEAIDETAVLGRFRLVKNAKETFSLYGLAGGDRDWGRDDWALSVGGGVQFKFHDNIALFADSRLRAWLNAHDGKSKDIATRVGLSIIIPGS